MNTPLATVFAGYDVDKLPVAFRDQFLATPERPYDVVLEGVMHRIWHRPRWFKPLFKLLGWLGILVPETGESIATTLTVVPGYLPDGQPFHEWNRTFAFPKPLHFNTRVVYDTVQDNLADLVGPDYRLHMVWKGLFTPPNTFTLATVTNGVRLGRRVRYLPRWVWLPLLGRVQFIQTARPDAEDTVNVDLRIVHPWFGEVFGYQGTFTAVRYVKGERAMAI
ncbi:MAG: DUF4166 domain-containing protein [Chloroflexi bacterium]|nr:DUF4166 domain-containing protein [Chloroflexota bacterium]